MPLRQQRGYHPLPEIRNPSRKQRKKMAKQAEEAVEIANEIVLDGFRNDPLYIAAFNHGDFGDINDADFETFGNVKTYIADTIFATEHQGQRDSNAGDADYTPSDGDGPKQLDVSEYYDNRELNLPAIYKEPAEIQMPESLRKYNTNVAVLPEKREFGDDDYPVEFKDTGFPEPTDVTEDRPYADYKGDGDKSDRHPERQAMVDPEWAERRRWRHNVKEIIGKDQDWKKWAKAAGVSNLNSKKDSDKIKEFYRLHNGVLPT